MKRKRRIAIHWVIILFCTLILIQSLSAQRIQWQNIDKKTTEFKSSLKVHLDAIVNQNYEAYGRTLSAKKISMIMPDGEYLSKKKEILSINKSWFDRTDWAFEYEIVRIEETDQMAFALLDVEYTFANENKKLEIMNFYLNMIFVLENREWKLLHDQNTIYNKIQTVTSSETKE